MPADVQRAVWHRNGGRCTFAIENGHRCEATTRLEFDHVHPVARGGRSTPENLRLRCRAHNQFGAECTYGRGFMAEKRQARKCGAAAGPARHRSAPDATLAEELRKRQALAERNRDVANAFRNLGYATDKVRVVLAKCGELPDASTEACVRLGLSLFTKGRKESFAPGASMPT